MSAIEIVFTILLNIIPILVISIPYFFIKKKIIGKLYGRILLGVIVFYIVYWVLPIVFQLETAPIELELQSGEEGNTALGIGYIVSHFLSLISLFGSYPLVTLPFIFLVAPFISIILVWNRLRKEKSPTKESLAALTYQLTESPYNRIRDELKKSDWSREKEILKLLIVLLPISLFLLQLVLSITNLETVSLTGGETALGWFLEILFVYLATFIFSIELLFSSQIALKGRYFGESIRTQTYKSLYTVGAPISILSIILFIVDAVQKGSTESIAIIIYFFAYFIMASVIFVLFLKIFEPISILIFIKIIDWWKHRKQKKKNFDTKNFYYGIVFACLAFFIYFVLNYVLFSPVYGFIFPNYQVIQESAKFNAPTQLLGNSLGFDVMNIFSFITLVITSLALAAFFLVLSLKYMRSILTAIVSYLPVLIFLSALFVSLELYALIYLSPDTYWITGQTSYTTIFGFNFYTLRTAGLEADLRGVLGILAVPYTYTRYIFNIIIWGLIIHYLRKEFKTKNLKIDEKHLEKLIFSSITDFITIDDYKKGDIQYLISKSENITQDAVRSEREEVQSLLNSLEQDKLLKELIPFEEKEKQRFYFTLKYLFSNDFIDILKPEFSYVFERVEKQGLYIIYDDGRGVFDYSFVREVVHDAGLVSGMVSAITSFIKETTKSQDLLKTIDHGDITIVLEYGKRIFGALFIKGKQTSEIRAKLKEFVERFESKYKTVLEDWSGALVHFKEDHSMVEEIFQE
ncbi:MAG: hypothetical protein ACXACC_03070 [Promethearchaeota archaeon]|jgi:hypothetical protein